MKRISDRQRVIAVHDNARFDRNREAPVNRQCSIYDGPPEDGGRQISDQKYTPRQAWRSAWERIEAAREASHGK
jgi:hypothetical protein